MMEADAVIREAALRHAVLAGDADAWRAWYAAVHAPLEAYVLWRCGRCRHFAEDVLQETWMVAIKRLRDFDPAAGRFAGWLRGVAAKTIANHLRSRERRAKLIETLKQPPANEEPADGLQVAETLAELPDHYEAALRAKYLDQRSVNEIAEERNESPKAVESLLTRARAAFREAYEKRMEGVRP